MRHGGGNFYKSVVHIRLYLSYRLFEFVGILTAIEDTGDDNR